MWKCSVPVILDPMDESLVSADFMPFLEQLHADRVFLAGPSIHSSDAPDIERFEGWMDLLKDKIAYFESRGLEVGFWMGHTIGHGGVLSAKDGPTYQQLVGHDGREIVGCFCPLDEKFRQYLGKAFHLIAETGVKLIMLDDDFRLNQHAGSPVGCFCPLHLAAFNQANGLNLTREEIVRKVHYGKPNTIRKAWMDQHGRSLLALAETIEASVHAVEPGIRIGLATAMTLWSSEGIDMKVLLRSLAGRTRPFLRLSGAPYWSKDPCHVSWVIEYSRLQASWMRDFDVELFAEGDTFPHTRFHCPATTLHSFQQGLRTAGLPGMLNYGIVYVPSPGFEKGYSSKSAAMSGNYEAISRFFPEEYLDSGITPVAYPDHFAYLALTEVLDDKPLAWPDEPVSIQILSRLGIPIAYDSPAKLTDLRSNGPVFIAGQATVGLSADELGRLLSRGAILDGVAAMCLMEQGVDVGIEKMEIGENADFEYFSHKESCGRHHGEHIWLLADGKDLFYRCVLRKEAEVITELMGYDRKRLYSGVFHYENAMGFRFCVLPFDLHRSRQSLQLMLNYARKEQLVRSIDWVGRSSLMVSVGGTPDLHVICRISPDGTRMAVALQNAHLDPVTRPVLRLDPRIVVQGPVELLQADAEEPIPSAEYRYWKDDNCGYLMLEASIPPMGLLGIGLSLIGRGDLHEGQ